MEEPSRQTDEEFWAEHDPFGDRFSTRVPWSAAFIAAMVVALAVYFFIVR
jgi:hypothetical protein